MQQLLNEILAKPDLIEGVAWKRSWYGPNERIIEKEDLGNSLFFVEEGIVRVLGETEIEGNVKLAPGFCDLQEGALFGDICLYDSHKRTASVVAVTNVCVLEIQSSELSHYLDAHPAFGYQFLKELFKIMVDRLELANKRIEYLLAWGLKVHDINKYL
jgi:CRP-like cAMP-binding protein